MAMISIVSKACFYALALTLTTTLALTLTPPSALAFCGPAGQMLEQLATKYGEHQFAIGTLDETGEAGAVTMQVNLGTGTFTIVAIHNEIGCTVIAGKNFIPLVMIPRREPGL